MPKIKDVKVKAISKFSPPELPKRILKHNQNVVNDYEVLAYKLASRRAKGIATYLGGQLRRRLRENIDALIYQAYPETKWYKRTYSLYDSVSRRKTAQRGETYVSSVFFNQEKVKHYNYTTTVQVTKAIFQPAKNNKWGVGGDGRTSVFNVEVPGWPAHRSMFGSEKYGLEPMDDVEIDKLVMWLNNGYESPSYNRRGAHFLEKTRDDTEALMGDLSGSGVLNGTRTSEDISHSFAGLWAGGSYTNEGMLSGEAFPLADEEEE
jgi:hypothetical protein